MKEKKKSCNVLLNECKSISKRNYFKYKSLFDGSHDAIAIFNIKFEYVEVNKAALKMFGCKKLADIISKNPLDFSPKYQPDKVMSFEKAKKMRKLVIDQGHCSFEWLHKRLNGKEFFANVLFAKITLKDEVLFQATIRNITSYKKMSKENEEREQFLSSVIENIPNFIFIKDAKHLRFVRINKAGEKLLGYKESELIGKSDYDFFPKKEADFFVSKDRKVLEIGKMEDIPEEEIHTKLMGTRVLHTKKIPLYDEKGKAKYLLGISVDITEKKKAEQKTEKFKLIADTASYGSAIVDLNWKILYLNDSFAKMHGYTSDYLIGKNLMIFHNKVQKAKVIKLIEKLKRTGSFSVEEVENITKKGRVFPTLMSATVIKNEKGMPLYFSATAIDISEIKNAEEELKENEDSFRALFESSHDAVIVGGGLQGGFFKANDKAIKMFKFKNEKELLALSPKQISPKRQPDGKLSAEKSKKMIEIAMKKGSHFFEWVHKRKTGEEFVSTVLLSKILIKGKVMVQGTIRDITDRKKAEDKLTMFRDLVDNAQDALLIVDPQTAQVLETNKAAEQMFKYSRKQLLNRKVIDLDMNVADLSEWQTIYKRIKREKSLLFERNVISSKGKQLPIEVSVKNVVRDKSYVVATLRDISERNKAKEEMEKIFNLSPYMLCVSNIKGYLTKISPAFNKILGYSEKELLKNKFLKFVHKDDIQRTLDVMKKMKTEECLNFENRYKCKDGTYKWIAWSASPYFSEGLSFAIGHDVTTRKKVEQEIVKSEEEVKQKNKDLIKNQGKLSNTIKDLQQAHLTLKETQEQLIQSEKLALLGQLAAGIAHEINNPVGFISSNIEVLEKYIKSYARVQMQIDLLLKEVSVKNFENISFLTKNIKKVEKDENMDFINEDIHMLLDESKRGTDRIKSIVNNLGVFARKDKQQMKLNKLEDILNGTINIIGSDFKYKCKVKKKYQKIPLIICNAEKLGQVFLNIIMNAAQSIKTKGEVCVKTYKKNNHVCVEISDTGEGISKENIRKMFDPFFTTKDPGKGTGLGLSISYDFVKQHGGEMSVDSVLGKGTTIKVMFPLKADKNIKGDKNEKAR